MTLQSVLYIIVALVAVITSIGGKLWDSGARASEQMRGDLQRQMSEIRAVVDKVERDLENQFAQVRQDIREFNDWRRGSEKINERILARLEAIEHALKLRNGSA